MHSDKYVDERVLYSIVVKQLRKHNAYINPRKLYRCVKVSINALDSSFSPLHKYHLIKYIITLYNSLEHTSKETIKTLKEKGKNAEITNALKEILKGLGYKKHINDKNITKIKNELQHIKQTLLSGSTFSIQYIYKKYKAHKNKGISENNSEKLWSFDAHELNTLFNYEKRGYYRYAFLINNNTIKLIGILEKRSINNNNKWAYKLTNPLEL